MPRSILSRKKAILLFVVATCLITALIAAWRIYPLRAQTSGPIQAPQEGKALSRMIDNLKSSGAQFRAVELLQTEQAPALTSFASSDALKQGVTLNFNSSAAAQLAASEDQTIAFRLPDPQGILEAVELELTRVNIFAEGYRVITSSSGSAPVDHQPGVHFRGAVKGAPGSLAAVSVFNNEVVGLYSLPDQGNFVLGKLKGDNPNNVHVLYSDADLKRENTWVCGTKDDKREINEITPSQDLTGVGTATAGGCVDVYVEADHDLFLNKGGVAQTSIYIHAFFNQSAAIFANDGIQIALSEFFVWDTPSPYAGHDTIDALLSRFQGVRASFNGDIGHLVALRGGGGRAGSFNALCNDQWDERQCFSGIDATNEIVDDYSWTVHIFSHEMGHLMGSRHTHACEWNVNGAPDQAIDGCSAPEGSCAWPEIPENGGTIMSYCHQTGDLRFANGFGPQPGDRIRNSIAAASCIAACVKDCIYAIHPTSHSFSSNGGSGSVTVIANNGCNWTAVSNNSFITITSGHSGFGNGTVNFSVASNGTTPRTGTIKIFGKTVTITQAAAPTSELIVNGGFESGLSPWRLTGNAYRSTGAYPYSGNAYAVVIDGNSEKGSVSQPITIPNEEMRDLTFRLNVSSQETSQFTAYDKLFVEVLYRDGSFLLRRTLAQFSNLNKGSAGVYSLRGPYWLDDFAGQTVDIQFRAESDSSLPTYFRIDSVSVRPPPPDN